jgi:hypothetical protein
VVNIVESVPTMNAGRESNKGRPHNGREERLIERNSVCTINCHSFLDFGDPIPVYLQHSSPLVKEMLERDLTLREHLKSIQSDGGKARWANLSPEERSAQARKAVEARWAKKRAAEVVPAMIASAPRLKPATKKSPRKKVR